MKVKTLIAIGMTAAAVTGMTAFVLGGTSAVETGTVGVSVSKLEVAPGDVFTAEVRLSDVPENGIAAVDFAVGYDPDVIEITEDGIVEGEISKTGAAEAELAANGDLVGTNIGGNREYSCLDYYIQDGQVRVIWATGLEDSEKWISQDGILLTISGIVKESTEEGDYPLTIEPTDRETYPGSGEKNEDVIFGYIGSDGPERYGVGLTDGLITVAQGETLWGDVNADGEVTVADVVRLAQHLLEDPALDPNQDKAGLRNAHAYSAVTEKPNTKDLLSIVLWLSGKDVVLGPQ